MLCARGGGTIPKGRERGEGNGRGKGSRRRGAGLFCMYASHPTTIRAAARVPSPWDDPAMLNPAIGHLPALRKAWTRVPVRVLITYVVVAVGHAWPARRWRRPCVHNKCCLFLASLANPRATRAETQQASKQASKPKSKLILGQVDSTVHKNCQALHKEAPPLQGREPVAARRGHEAPRRSGRAGIFIRSILSDFVGADASQGCKWFRRASPPLLPLARK